MPLLADFSLGHALLTVVSIFLFVVWFWILITIIGDLLNDHDTSGWAKAGWVFFLIFIPFLGMLVYLIVRGQGMSERALAARQDAEKQFDAYVKQAAGSGSAADELHKLSELKAKGDLSEAEFEAATAKLLS
jgi:hypothetical protein